MVLPSIMDGRYIDGIKKKHKKKNHKEKNLHFVGFCQAAALCCSSCSCNCSSCSFWALNKSKSCKEKKNINKTKGKEKICVQILTAILSIWTKFSAVTFNPTFHPDSDLGTRAQRTHFATNLWVWFAWKAYLRPQISILAARKLRIVANVEK